MSGKIDKFLKIFSLKEQLEKFHMETHPIQVRISWKRLIAAAAYAIVLSLFLIQLGTHFNVSPLQYRIVGINIAVSTVFIGLDLEIENERFKFIYNLILVIILSSVVVTALDLLNEMYELPSETSKLSSAERYLISLLFSTLIYAFVISIVGRIKPAVIGTTVGFLILGFVSYAVLVLRGSRFVYSDIAAFSTAVDVLGGYNSLPINQGFWLGMLSFVCAFSLIFSIKPQRFYLKSISRLALYLVFIFAFFSIYMTDFEDLNYSWLESENSYLFSFVANAKLLNVHPPNNYNAEEVEEILADEKVEARLLESGYDAKAEITKAFPEYVQRTGTTNPNIIVVMNESYSDLEIFGDIPVKEEIFPVTSRLTNCLKGDLYTEVFGGGTSDTEYSYLTGNSTSQLPINARPYQLYVRENSPNMSTRLKELGYETVAIHPGQATAWNREAVYEDFDFDQFYSAKDFEDQPYRRIEDLKTDAVTYDKIIELYQKKGNKPLFAFDVTIQNHGGYNLSTDRLDSVTINGEASSELKQYLSLIRASDVDFSRLINYFSKQNEPTIICMFGDHQPNLLSQFPAQMMYKERQDFTLEEDQRQQITPYIIWANYPLPATQVGPMSINFLSTLTLECAGIESTAYERYLKNLYQTFLVLDRKGVMDREGNYYTYDDSRFTSSQRDLIDEYQNVLYYSTLEKNRDDSLFGIQNE